MEKIFFNGNLITVSSERNLFLRWNIFMLFLFFLNLSSFSQTISPKKGISGDLLDNNDCIRADSLTWYYNWANTPNATVSATHQNYIEFCPMLWNGNWNPTALNNYLTAHPEVDYLLAFNEPNFSVQANMTPTQAAALWPQVEAIANTHNLKIVSPAMSYCAGTCLAGYDNMDGTKWLDEFFAACPGCRVDYIGLHIYDTWYYGFWGNVNPYRKYNRPIWVTEFDYSGATTSVQHASLMVDAINYMEHDPMIFRYAWFLTRSSPVQESTDIFTQATGGLTDLGKIYFYMSSYDENHYHTVNKIIEAEHYIDKSVTYCNWNGSACTWPYSVLLQPTTDINGKLNAYNFASPVNNTNDTLYYLVDIPTTQAYTIDFRVNTPDASTISIRTYPGNTLIGTTTSLNTSGAWATRTLSVGSIPAGQQTIYFTAANGANLKLNWFRINCSANCGSLPVEWNYFNASRNSSENVTLEWETISENDNAGFIIERSSDGTQYDSIGFVIAGKSLDNYYYTDESAPSNVLDYRLKQLDIDGKSSYSSVKTVSARHENLIYVMDDFIVTEFGSPQDVFYSVVNTQGVEMAKGEYRATESISRKKIITSEWSKGVYYVTIISEGISQSEKIVLW